MEIHDISLTISPDLVVWPGDGAVELTPVARMAGGDACNVTRIAAGVHVGTHVDAPFHFVAGGKTVESLPLSALNGPATVVELADTVDRITADHLTAVGDCERVLLKTRNSRHWASGDRQFDEDYVALDEEAARFLVGQGVKLVGIDYLSVAPFAAAVPVHRCLLEAEVVIVEGLNLTGIEPGSWQLHCLPLKISGADGAPARAILCR